MKKFEIDGYTFSAEKCIDGTLINPELPKDFYMNDLSERESEEMDMWFSRPYVEAEKHEAFESGTRYSVWCLDGGAWDRPTSYGHYGELNLALIKAKELCSK